MGTYKVDRSQWKTYFDSVTKQVESKQVNVLVEGLDLGVQVEAEMLPLVGLSYDAHSDELEIAFDDLMHHISAPREIWVKEGEGGQLECFEVIDGEEHKQIVEIIPPLPR